MQVELDVEERNTRGKVASRQLRARGLIPAVCYGPGAQPFALAVPPKAFQKALGTEFGRNAVFQLRLGDRNQLAVLREVQIHPVTRQPIHLDFFQVEPNRPVELRVPFRVHGKSVGVTKGGELHVVFRDLPVRALPDKIPARIEVDVTELDLHAAIFVKDIALPEGVIITLPPQQTVVSVQTEKKKAPEEEEAKPGAAAAAPAAAPAAAEAKK